MALGRYGGAGGTGAVVWEVVRSARLGGGGRRTGDEKVVLILVLSELFYVLILSICVFDAAAL